MSKADAEDYVRSKNFPEDYPKDVIQILRTMSFTDLKGVMLLGSMSLRSQLYAGDYDAYEVIELDEDTDEEASKKLALEFKAIVRDLMDMNDVSIGDIKCGIYKEWQILPDNNYIKNNKVYNLNRAITKERAKKLYDAGVVKKEDYDKIEKILSKTLTAKDIFELRDIAKYHVVRWKPIEVLQGFKLLGSGPKQIRYTLQDGFLSKGLCKMDVVAFVENNRYTDFSMIYEAFNNGKTINMAPVDIVQSLKENILSYMMVGNYFKMSKRMFALSKFKKYNEYIKKLAPIFNTDLGLIYQVVGDIGTLLYLFENEKHLKLDKIKYETDQFKNRLANVYTLKKWFTEDEKINERLDSINRLPEGQRSRGAYIGALEDVKKHLESLLNMYSKKELENKNLLPVPKKFLP